MGHSPPSDGHYSVKLIQHTTRHSDLRLHTYVPRGIDPFWCLPLADKVAGLEGAAPGGRRAAASGTGPPGGTPGLAAGCGSLARMNPLAALEVGDLEKVRCRADLLKRSPPSTGRQRPACMPVDPSPA